MPLSNLAELYRAMNRYHEAEELYSRAIAIQEKVLGPEHPDLAVTLNDLAELYRNEGRLAEAEPLYRRSLAIREKALRRRTALQAHAGYSRGIVRPRTS